MLRAIMPRRWEIWMSIGVTAVALAGCAVTPRVAIERATASAGEGKARAALEQFDAVALRRDLSDSERIEALVGAAHACDQLGDGECARSRLERAVDRDVPGLVEPVEFELAERLRDRDPGRALSLYYRAAGGAEKHRAGGFPYRAAMDRILQLSMSPGR
jgi:hypothetical protein